MSFVFYLSVYLFNKSCNIYFIFFLQNLEHLRTPSEGDHPIYCFVHIGKPLYHVYLRLQQSLGGFHFWCINDKTCASVEHLFRELNAATVGPTEALFETLRMNSGLERFFHRLLY